MWILSAIGAGIAIGLLGFFTIVGIWTVVSILRGK